MRANLLPSLPSVCDGVWCFDRKTRIMHLFQLFHLPNCVAVCLLDLVLDMAMLLVQMAEKGKLEFGYVSDWTWLTD